MLFIVSLFFFPNELLENYKWLTLLLIAAFFVCIHPGANIARMPMIAETPHIPAQYSICDHSAAVLIAKAAYSELLKGELPLNELALLDSLSAALSHCNTSA